MKTFRFLGIAIAALFMTVNFTSCNNEGITPEDQEEKYIEVDLGCTGEILDIENSPLAMTKANSADVYHIKVFTLEQMSGGTGGESYVQSTPYANGHFSTSLNGVTIRLLEGKSYKFVVTIVINEDIMVDQYTSREFTYSTTHDPAFSVPVYKEGYYGELASYTPVEGSSVLIDTKRVSYGAKFEALNLTEGKLEISVAPSYYGGNLYSVELTPMLPISDKIYSFSDNYSAWAGNKNTNGDYDPMQNYSATKKLTVSWTKADGSVVPLGTFSVTFERNVKTTVKIKAEEAGSSNGITVVKENVPMVDDDKEYQISGGTVTEVPVNNA